MYAACRINQIIVDKSVSFFPDVIRLSRIEDGFEKIKPFVLLV